MKKFTPAKTSIRITVAAALAVLLAAGTAATVRADGTTPDAPAATNCSDHRRRPGRRPSRPRAPLTGAALYSMHCNRCHPERYPTERTAAQWKTIMLHMQVRANIPVKQSRLILQYLQENSGR